MSLRGSHDPDDWRTFGLLEVAVTGFVVFALGLALLLPDDIYERSAGVRVFADGVARVVLTIDDFAGLSSFPGVTRVTLATLWTMVPVVAWLLWSGRDVLQWNREAMHAAAKVRWAIVGVFLFCSLGAPILLSFNESSLEGYSKIKGLVTFASTSRFGLGLIAGIYCAVSALFLSMIPTFLNRNNFR